MVILLLEAFNRRSISNLSADCRNTAFKVTSIRGQDFVCQGTRVMLFAPPWLDEFFSIIQSVWSNIVTLAPWHTKSRMRLLVASKAVFLENYLAVSTWILNGSSIEWLEKKYQHFSLAGVRFGRQVNQISGLKFAWRGSELCLTLLLYNCCYKRSLRNNPRNQTNIFRLHVTLTMPRSQSCIIKSFLQG